MLAACGDEDGNTDGDGTDGGDSPPTLSGEPATSVVVNAAYSFKPAAADPDGDPLLFGVDGLPPWAEFDSLTGEMTGTPDADDVGTYRGIVVWVTDGEHDTLLPAFDLVVEPETASTNQAPTITGTPSEAVVAGELYRFMPEAADAEGDALAFTIRNQPAWATFGFTDGLLQGTPTDASAGTYDDIVIAVSDGTSTTTLPPFSITVTLPGVNTAPTISGSPMTSVAVSTAYSFTPTASDIDGNTLTFSVENAPSWATFDPATGELAGTPGADHAGTYEGIVIAVTDGIETAALAPFSLTVTPATDNTPPTIAGSPSLSVLQGAAYDFTPSAADADGDTLTFAIANAPAWAAFDTATGRLNGTPDADDVGRYGNIVISVSDGEASAALPGFSIAVEAQNSAPTLSGTPGTSVEQGAEYSFQPTASDADGDALIFAVSNAPAWAAFDTATGRLSGTPGAEHVGTHADIVISATDGAATAELAPFSVTVTAAPTNAAPTISGTPPASIVQGSQYTFTPTASDADGDTLTFSIANRPSWLTFNGSTGQLQGTAVAGAVGAHQDIRISVSDGKATAELPAFSITVTALAANRPPAISGTPPSSATAGAAYSFQPTASDPDDDTLTFTIANKPSWATFSGSTGRLEGTPSAADVGTYSNIQIGVSDGEAAAQLAAFAVTVVATNGAPTLSGTPATTVMQGAEYVFQPSADDPDDDALTFQIANKPAWAAFDAATGRLSGTPGAADVGSYSNIGISVTDGEAEASLAAFEITVTAVTNGSATLTWTAPTQKTDGSPLTDLAGFKVYWGTQEGRYPNEATIDTAGVTTYVIESLTPGTWYFVTTAVDTNGTESDHSNVATKTIE